MTGKTKETPERISSIQEADWYPSWHRHTCQILEEDEKATKRVVIKRIESVRHILRNNEEVKG